MTIISVERATRLLSELVAMPTVNPCQYSEVEDHVISEIIPAN